MASPAGIYIHIPFCRRKCNYCDFFSKPIDEEYVRKAYTRALLKEIGFYGAKYGKNFVADSIFFGGGTPTLMEPELIDKILAAVRKSFFIAAGSEITMEGNPATVTGEKLRRYRQSGVNRLSIGAQSFDDEILSSLGRVHRAADITRTVELAREAGFDNISLDLMFAVPGQDMNQWLDSVKKALALKPQHISFYSLEIEPATVFGDMLESGALKETPAEVDREMYHRALALLDAAGFVHYEISSAALPARECRHNLKYWDLSEYLGLGAGAHSFIRDTRYSNIDDVEMYFHTMWSQDSASSRHCNDSQAFASDCVSSCSVNSYRDSVTDYVFTALRTRRGVVFKDFSHKFKNEFWDLYSQQQAEFEKFVRAGYAEYDDRRLALTRKGIDIASRITRLFM